MRPLVAVGLAVDVVVNNHNYGNFVSAAIESALAQTHSRVKVIVVDDGSTRPLAAGPARATRTVST